ncbi:MAG: BatD family protein, partial [Candidatus Binatia bacterium]
MKRAIQLILLLIMALACGPWSAVQAKPSLEVHVDRDQISLDEQVTLTIVLRGATAMATPDIPALGHFDVVGRTTGSSVEIINGEMTVQRTFEYVLEPREAGDFSIGPIKLFVEGQEYTAGPIRVRVGESKAGKGYQPHAPFPTLPAPGVPQPGQPSMPQFPGPWGGTPPGGPVRIPPAGEDTFMTAELDQAEAYVGEQVIYTFRIYTRVSIQDAQLEFPELKDFLNEELTKERKYNVDIQGQRFLVQEWRLALFPTKAGELETGIPRVRAKVPVRASRSPFDDPFFSSFAVGMKPKTFSAPNQRLRVKP